tara:strand:+ start:3087 stop:4358 length:1272 start_codon:yes stop_codon:yes gene_type:complete
MKFIGQFIQDFIARFRNDVYLEDISTGTIASGGNLGLDANNKIVKADTNAGELSITNAADNRVVTSTGGTGLNAEALFTWNTNTGDGIVASGLSSKPEFSLLNANLDANGPIFNLKKSGLSPANSDIVGTINFVSLNSSFAEFNYFKMVSSIVEVTAGDEIGSLKMFVGSDGAERNFFQADGQADGTVDLTLGSGGSSSTTLAGSLSTSKVNLTSSGQLLFNDLDNSHTVRVLNQTNTLTDNRTIQIPDQDGIVQLQGTGAGKQLQVFVCNFFDNIGTTTHYIPFKDINEQTAIYQDEVAMHAPCDGRIVSVSVSPHAVSNSSAANLTVGVHTRNVNNSMLVSSSSWTDQETETLVVTGTDDNHTFHFAFDNAKHFDSTQKVSLSIKSDVSLGSSSFFYTTVVVEWDWTTFLGTTSAEIEATP